MKVNQRIGLVATVVLAGIVIAKAQDNWVTIQLPYADYGHVYNTVNGQANGVPIGYCAPTATANSFVFLENHYQSIYQGMLLNGGTAINLRDSLALGWNSPGGIGRPGMYNPGLGGSTDQSWWEYKVQYIEDFAPNTTVFGGMTTDNTAGWFHGGDLTAGSPTWGYLWKEVSDAENVEIKIWANDMDSAHALTLSSMKFNDNVIANGVWDVGEARMMDYVDPNNPQPDLLGRGYG